MEFVRVGDKEVPIEEFDGPSDEELREAYARNRAKNARLRGTSTCGLQRNPSRVIGTPRHRKHKGRTL
jgi:hypothetical protein